MFQWKRKFGHTGVCLLISRPSRAGCLEKAVRPHLTLLSPLLNWLPVAAGCCFHNHCSPTDLALIDFKMNCLLKGLLFLFLLVITCPKPYIETPSPEEQGSSVPGFIFGMWDCPVSTCAERWGQASYNKLLGGLTQNPSKLSIWIMIRFSGYLKLPEHLTIPCSPILLY